MWIYVACTTGSDRQLEQLIQFVDSYVVGELRDKLFSTLCANNVSEDAELRTRLLQLRALKPHHIGVKLPALPATRSSTTYFGSSHVCGSPSLKPLRNPHSFSLQRKNSAQTEEDDLDLGAASAVLYKLEHCCTPLEALRLISDVNTCIMQCLTERNQKAAPGASGTTSHLTSIHKKKTANRGDEKDMQRFRTTATSYLLHCPTLVPTLPPPTNYTHRFQQRSCVG